MSRTRKGAVPQRDLPRSYVDDRCPKCGRIERLSSRSLESLAKETLAEIRNHDLECPKQVVGKKDKEPLVA